MKLKAVFMAILFTGILALPTLAATVAKIDKVDEGDLEFVGFELSRDAEINIDAVGVCTLYSRSMSVYSWIVDATTREPVWEMRRSDSDRISDTKYLRQTSKKIKLPAGRYELYMFANESWQARGSKGRRGLSDAIKLLTDGNDSRFERRYRRNLRKCYVNLSTDKDSGVREFDITGEVPSLFQHIQVGDDDYLSQPFELNRELNLRIYALSELPDRKDPPVDAGWIIDTSTRERVWQMTRRNTKHAGGHEKNRVFDDEVNLPAGKYILYYASDDSHSFPHFNTPPPLDPVSWGITLKPGKNFDSSAFALTENSGEQDPLVDLTRIRNNEFQEETFELKSAAELRIFALGEYSSGDREFVDYGWITDLSNGKTVWEMTRRNTDHAGGGDKNRQFDGYVTLPAGKYQIHYITDDSHAYNRWNVAAPFNARSWGIAVYPGADGGSGDLTLLSEEQIESAGGYLVKMVRIRDGERRREKFEVGREGKVRIFAIGEYSARDREFVDYAWIEDDNGRVVWEMTRRNTNYAGGDKKNRLFDDVVNLEPGRYRAHYRSDGSHAFGDWNASRPDDPMGWGITIQAANGN